jgi:hypothetical protein
VRTFIAILDSRFCCVYGKLYCLRTLHLRVDRKCLLSVHMLRLNDLYLVVSEYTGHMIDGYGRERSMRCKSDARQDIAQVGPPKVHLDH